MAAPDLKGTHAHPCLSNPNPAKPKSNINDKIEISTELIMKLRNNAYNRAEAIDAVDHVNRFLQIIDVVKTPNVNTEELCVMTFPYSLTGEAHRWWIKDRLKAARDHQKSYAGKRRKPLEFSIGDHVLLKVSPWKGVVRFRKKGKLAPRFVLPFEIIKKVGIVTYRLDLPEELNGVHDTFHMSNLKKCLADPTLQVPLDEIRVDDKLNFVEEPVEIME
ncbi:hypothetical protein Tco_1459554 [Tanacetum coccineum]